jgi:hypothetical protein
VVFSGLEHHAPFSGKGGLPCQAGEISMAFEELKAQIGALLTGLEDQPEDKHELYELIREKLAQMRAMGMPLPDDLVELEAKLEREFQSGLPDGTSR